MDLVSKAHKSSVASVGRFAEYSSGGFQPRVGGSAALATCLPVPVLNVVTPKERAVAAGEVANAAAKLSVRLLSYGGVLTEGDHAELESAVLKVGLSVTLRSSVTQLRE